MKVFHIDSEKSFRGGQRQVLYLLDGLNERGVENYLFCPGSSPLFERAALSSKIPAPMLGEFDIFSALKIAKRINGEKPDILHAHSAHALSVAILAKKFAGHKPKIAASRRVDFHIKSLKKYSAADIIIAVSDFIGKILLEDGLPKEKVSVVKSGIDLGEFANISGDYLKEEFSLSNEKIVIGNVAALTGQKDHITLLKAFQLLPENFLLFIVGKGHLRRKLEKAAENLKLGKRVVFTGFREDARNFLKIFDIFVLSSRWEGLGTSILDAMAAGCAVIASDVGGIPEIIEDSVSGFLFKAGDAPALAEKIMVLASEPAIRKAMAEKGRERAADFSADKMVEKTLEVYGKVLNGK